MLELRGGIRVVFGIVDDFRLLLVMFHNRGIETLHLLLVPRPVLLNDTLVKRDHAALSRRVLFMGMGALRRTGPAEVERLVLVRTRQLRRGYRIDRTGTPCLLRRSRALPKELVHAPLRRLEHLHVEGPIGDLRRSSQTSTNEQQKNADNEKTEDICTDNRTDLRRQQCFVSTGVGRRWRTVFGRWSRTLPDVDGPDTTRSRSGGGQQRSEW